jgi:hypothetical protein
VRLRCTRIDVFFMIGLPAQTTASVRDTVEYCGHLFKLGDKRLSCFISPMGPFIDPGSRGFEEPERFGYRLFARTLEEHRQLLIQPTWEHILNYETKWMTRRELVDATYDAAERLNELKVQHGRLSARRGRGVAAASPRRVRCARGSMPGSPAATPADGRGAQRGDLPLQHLHGLRQARAVLAATSVQFQDFRIRRIVRILRRSILPLGATLRLSTLGQWLRRARSTPNP